MTLCLHGLVTSLDKLKPSYLHYHNTYGLGRLLNGDLPSLPSTHKVTWLYNKVILQDPLTN